MRWLLLPCFCFALFSAGSCVLHAQDFSVDFTNCTEFAGEGPVPYGNAAPLVPAGYTLTKSPSGEANIVIRAAGCGSVTVNGHDARPTSLSQIGVNIVSPDGTGTINNYTVVYLSDNPDLVAHFNLAGFPAQYDPQLKYEFTGTPATAGNLYVAAGSPFVSPYFIYGPETPPALNSAEAFLANWWYAPQTIFGRARMRQQTLFPAISFGTSAVTFYTDSTSLLGKLIGGNTFSAFTTLALRGVASTGHMEVTVTK